MECTQTIRRLGSSPQGNKIMAKFTGVDMPDAVEVDGTNDRQNVAGDSGTWVSGNKYSSLTLCLNLYKNGSLVKKCCYAQSSDPNIGIIITAPPKINGFNASSSNDGSVVVSWTSETEDGVQSYSVDRLDVLRNFAEPDLFIQIPTGPGTTYSNTDNPGSGTYIYSLRATTPVGDYRYPNGSSTVTVE